MSKILILGAGVTQVPLIQCAKAMGHIVYVASIDGDYPGFHYADKIFLQDTTNAEGILEIARKEQIDGICTTGTDVAVRSIGYVNSHLGLCGISYASALKVTDKALMKKALVQKGVRTAEFYQANSVREAEEYAEKIGYPVMIKCTDQAASKGITRVNSREEIRAAVNYALEKSFNTYVVVEKFLEGFEAGLDGYYSAEEHVFIPHGKMVFKAEATDVPLGHYLPFECSKELYEDICQQAELACQATELNHVFINMDIMICEGKCYVIEIGGRTGATCIPDLLTLYCGYDYYEKIIQNCLGKKVDMKFTPQRACRAELLVSNKEGIISSINREACLAIPDVSIVLDYKEGEKVRKFRVGTDRLGHIIASGRDVDETIQKIEEAKRALTLVIS